MAISNGHDYSETGLTIQQAMVDHVKRHPDKGMRPGYILWNGSRVQTSDVLEVPSKGIVRAEFVYVTPGTRQGFEMKVDGGFRLAEGELVPILRTWKEDRFEDFVEYPYSSRNGQMFVWNIYEMIYPSGEKVVEKWTENAGVCVEFTSDCERIYHCSHGMANPPNFESLVFKLSFRPN